LKENARSSRIQVSPMRKARQTSAGSFLPIEAEKKRRAAAAVSSSAPLRGCSKRVAEAAVDAQADAKLTDTLENTRRSLKKLQSENKQLKASLDGLNSNLKAVMNSCHDSGVAGRMAKIIDSFESKRELKGGGVCVVWDRLYSDAMGRVDRMERCRAECALSPQRASSKQRAPIDQSEMKWQSQTFSHVAPDPLESASVSPTIASFGDLAGLSGSCWSLPPCSASRQARCASAHRLRASRQASRGRLLLSSCVVSPHGEEQGLASRSSTASPPCRRPKTSLSLPSLHGHRHPSYQNN
jgi:hypothetical protein